MMVIPTRSNNNMKSRAHDGLTIMSFFIYKNKFLLIFVTARLDSTDSA